MAAFRRALNEFLRRADDGARGHGLTAQQYQLLLTVRGHHKYPAVTIGNLSEAMKLQQSSMSLLVDRCVRKGHVLREEDPTDRRRALVRLSDAGQALLDEIMAANRAEIGRFEAAVFGTTLIDALHRPPSGDVA